MRWFILLGLWILLPYLAISQGAIKKKSHLSEKVFFGGGLGLQFGSVTAIDVSPMVGYKPKPNWFLGIKGNYQYYNDNTNHASTQIYGGSFFTSYILFENIALYGEYEALNLESAYFDPANIHSKNSTFWVHSPLLGGGFVQPIGDRSKMLILVLWNLSNSNYTYYSNPIIRLTFFY